MILGLFTELLSTGGIQRAGRHSAAVLASWAEHRRMPFRFISLNDPQGLHRLRIAALEFSVSGYGRSKVPFILAALRAARRKPKLILAAHPHLAPVVRAMNLLAPAARTLIITHGIEVWNPLKSLRRQALRAADCVLAPSTDTARRVAEVQGVAPEKICVLPWGLDPPFAASQDDCPEGALPEGFPAGRVILTVGRWASNEGYKGADTLILALL